MSAEQPTSPEQHPHQPPVSRTNSKPKGILKNAPLSGSGGTQQYARPLTRLETSGCH